MNMPSMNRSTLLPEWSPEEVALAEALRGGDASLGESPLPDPGAIFILSQTLGTEAPPRSLPVRILLSQTFLTLVGSLPIAIWLAYRWKEIGANLPSPTWSTLISLGRRLSAAGTPGWEAGAVLLCVFLYLSYEYLFTPPHRT